jgi:predicted dehydrogenase
VTVRLGLVGLGYWGPNLARVIADVKGGQLAALCDADPARLDRVARRYPETKLVADYEQMLGDDVDAIVIATPADTHYELAMRALRAGKHVLVEKPLARSSDECLELIEVARAAELVLMPGHVFLYNAAVRKVRSYIESGELGEVYYAYSQRLNLGQVRRDVNALWNFAPHDLSIIGWWFGGAPERVVARGYSYVQPGIEDVVFMTLDYPGGVGANVHLSWLDPLKVRLMTVVGSEKMVVYDDTSPDARIQLYDKGVTRQLVEDRPGDATLGRYETFAQFQLLLRAGDVLIPRIDFVEPLQLEIEDFLAAVRGERVPVSNAQTGLQVVRTLEAAQRSLEAAGAPVAV